MNEPETQPLPLSVEINWETVDLGCCVKGIKISDTAHLGVNSVSHVTEDFIMTLNTDKTVYGTSDDIRIWGTLEYIGGGDEITIWHGCPFMHYTVSDGDKFHLGWFQYDILDSSTLKRGVVYHFEYAKSGGWDGNSPEADYWRAFFDQEGLFLHEGEYTVTLYGAFSMNDRIRGSESGLRCVLRFTVE
jgi:hypothetical protein